MTLKSIGPNCHEVSDGTRSVLFSYATPVAYHVAGQGYYRSDRKWSVTTSRHVNAWIGGADASEVTQAHMDDLRIAEGGHA